MGYGLDSFREVTIQKFWFIEKYDSLTIDLARVKSLSPVDFITGLRNFLVTLDSSTCRGFITGYDLRKYPIISDILPCFTSEEKYISGAKSQESYKWLYNLIHLNLYMSCVEKLQTSDLIECNTLQDLKVLEKELFGRLDSSIRYYLQKRGVSIQNAVYTGFDTEYTQIAEKENRLVSSQLAVVCKSSLKIPRVESYSLSRLDSETNKLVKITKGSSEFNYPKVENSIRICVQVIRQVKCGNYDSMMKKLQETFKLIKGVSCYEGDESNVFSLPPSSIQPFIKISDSFSFEELLETSAAISQPICHRQFETIREVLNRVSSADITLDHGMDAMLGQI